MEKDCDLSPKEIAESESINASARFSTRRASSKLRETSQSPSGAFPFSSSGVEMGNYLH
jgi:hypothetical protein